MPDGMSYSEFMNAPAPGTPPQASVAPAPSPPQSGGFAQQTPITAQPSANAPLAFPGGGGVLPDGSATQDPAVWQRWMRQGGYTSAQPQTGQQAPTLDQATPPAQGMSYDEFMHAPGPSSLPAGKLTGLAANIGAGASDAIAGTLGAPVDLVTGALNLGSRGVRAVTGYDPGQISNPLGGSESIRTAMGYLNPGAAMNAASSGINTATGLDLGQIQNPVGADPRMVAPADAIERLGRAGGAGAASIILPWSIARALPVMGGVPGAIQRAFGAGSAATQGAAGFAGGVTGQVAQDAAPDALKPYANMAGNMLGGGLVLGSVAMTRALIDSGADLSRAAFQPLTAAGQQQLAGARIAGAATDLPAVQEALAAPNPPLVPGSQPTTFQLTADPGLGNLERAVAKNAPDQFNARAADQNEARVAAIQNLAPANASPEAVGAAFRAQLDKIDQFNAAAEGSARTTAQNATNALGGVVPATADQQTSVLQRYGQTLRGGLAAGNTAAKASEARLWQAIDPDGTLTVNMRPVKQAAQDIIDATPKNAAPMTGEPGAIFAIARLQKAVQPFSELTALRSRITDALRTELQTNGRTQTYGRLSRLLDSVHDAMQSSVQDQAAEDAHGVASGTMNPDDAIVSRIKDFADDAGQSQAAAAADGARGPYGAGAVGIPGTPSPLPPGTYRTEGARGGGPGSYAGSPSIQEVARAGVAGQSPPSLLSFLIARGGVRDAGGELAAMNAGRQRVGFVRVNGGMPFDTAREAAEEAGYLPRGSDINDFLDAVNTELRGQKVYPHAWSPRVDQSGAISAEWQAARAQVLRAEEDTDERLSPDEIDHATDMTARGMHPADAIREAARAAEDRALAANTLRQAFTGEGMPSGATQADMGLNEPGAGRPATFDPEAPARYQAARNATAERHSTYTNAPGVGAVLKPGRIASEFAMGDSQVPAALFNGGSGAAERMQAFMRAGGSRPDLVRAMQDYAAFDLRRSAERPDGTLDPAKFAKWRDAHAEAMTTFPELAQRFQSAATASRALDAAAANRTAAREAFETSAAARFLGDADPVASVGRILRSDTATARMADLARMTANDPAARAGLQRAVADFMLRDLRGNTVLGGSEAPLLKSDAFQTFMRKTADPLSQIFSPEQLASMRAVAADLQRAQRSISGTKLQGGSNTAQDLAAGAKHTGHGQTTLAQVVIAEAVGDIAEHVAGPAGKAAGIVTLVMNAMRQAGLKKVDDLVTEAMLHPEIARTLLLKAPTPANAKFIGQTLAAQLRALAANSSVTARRDQPPAPVPRYTGIATPRSAPRVSDFVGPGAFR